MGGGGTQFRREDRVMDAPAAGRAWRLYADDAEFQFNPQANPAVAHKAVVPGRPADSPLYQHVRDGKMPPGKVKLSPHEIDVLRGWIAAGTQRIAVALGRSGIKVNKWEGDGATPAGSFRPLRVWWRGDRGQRPSSPLHPITGSPGCPPLSRPGRDRAPPWQRPSRRSSPLWLLATLSMTRAFAKTIGGPKQTDAWIP